MEDTVFILGENAFSIFFLAHSTVIFTALPPGTLNDKLYNLVKK